jgi:hypothetical protein
MPINANPAVGVGGVAEVFFQTIEQSGNAISQTDFQDASADFKKYILSELRCAVLRCRIAENNLIAAGVALHGGLISPAEAIDFINEAGCIGLIAPIPPISRESQ